MEKKGHSYLVILIFSGMLAAISIVLTRLVSIPIGNTIRIGIGELPVFLAGLWFGPLAGGAVGAVADIIGALISTGWNPWLTIPAALTGLLIGFAAKVVKLGENRGRGSAGCAVKLFCSIFTVHVFCSGILMTALLNYFYPSGEGFSALLATRLIIAVVETIVQSIIVYVLYTSKSVSSLICKE